MRKKRDLQRKFLNRDEIHYPLNKGENKQDNIINVINDNPILVKIVNRVMKDGKKEKARNIVLNALLIIKSKMPDKNILNFNYICHIIRHNIIHVKQKIKLVAQYVAVRPKITTLLFFKSLFLWCHLSNLVFGIHLFINMHGFSQQ